MTPPVLDEAASARAGEPLELLPHALATRRAFTPDRTLGHPALEFLWESRDRGLQSGARRRSTPAVELRAAGLMNSFGAPSPEAIELLGPMSAPAATIIATVTGGGMDEQWSCWFRGRSATVDERRGDDEPHGLSLVPGGVAAARLLDWLGVTPAWSFTDGPTGLEESLLDARCADETTPPPADAGPALLGAWSSGAWRRVLVADGSGHGVLAVRTATGWWQLQPNEDGTVALEPMPTALLVARLLSLMPWGGS